MVFEETLSPVAEALIRFSSFAGHAVIFGCVPILLLVLRPTLVALDDEVWGRGRRRVARRIDALVVSMLVVSAAAALLGVLLKAILIADLKRTDLTADSFNSVLSTSFGQWFALRVPLVIVLAVLLVGRIRNVIFAPMTRGAAIWWGAWATLGVALLASTTLAGHAAVATPRFVAVASDIVHLASGSTWFTGIVFLAIVLPDAWISKEPVERLSVLAPVVLRFSRVALIAIAVVAATGFVNSLLNVGELNDLTGTSYGKALLIKLLLFAVILVLGAVNHFVLRRRFEDALEAREPTSAHRVFRRTIAIELAVAVGLMGVTGALVGLARTKGVESAIGVELISPQQKL